MAVRLISIIVHALSSELFYREKGDVAKEVQAGRQAEYADNRGTLKPADMHTERFTTYYQAQNIIPHDEWDIFMDSLRQPLPATFRIAGSRQYGLSPFTQERHVLTVMQG